MALTETKIIQVDNDPGVINECNRREGIFGWSVLNVQITHSQNTKTYTSGLADYYTGSKTVETTTINYATITYQRDKHMANYAEYVSLEREYLLLSERINDLTAMPTVYGDGMFKYFSPSEKTMTIIASLFLFPFGVIAGLYIGFSRSAAAKKGIKMYSSPEVLGIRAEMDKIFDKAERLG